MRSWQGHENPAVRLSIRDFDLQLFNDGDKIKLSERQFGRKIGQHAREFGLDPGNEDHRMWLREYIKNAYSHPDETPRDGLWRGITLLANGQKGEGAAVFYRKGTDVIVTDTDGNFITILKDGIRSKRFQKAIPRK